MDNLTLEYLDMYEKYPGEADIKIVRAHLHKFMHSGFNTHGHTDLRDKLNKLDGKKANIDDLRKLVMELKERRKDVKPIDKITWYYRHWKDNWEAAKAGRQNKQILPSTKIMDAEWDSWMADDPRNPQSLKVKAEIADERANKKAQKKIAKQQKNNVELGAGAS